jgi:hypothetical protein
MTTFREDIQPDLDDLRGIPNDLGLRQFTVTITVRQWTGERVGVGTRTQTSAILSTSHGQAPVKVVQVTQKEILASGGLYADRDLKVGPMTPAYPGGGVPIGVLDPLVPPQAQEIFWNVAGPGLPSGGSFCDKINTYADANLHEYVILRASGRKP